MIDAWVPLSAVVASVVEQTGVYSRGCGVEGVGRVVRADFRSLVVHAVLAQRGVAEVQGVAVVEVQTVHLSVSVRAT